MSSSQGPGVRPLSADDLTMERLGDRLQRIEQQLSADGVEAADCGTFLPCRRLKSCGSFSLTSPPSPTTPT